jgi:hypothetical protein
MKFLLPVGGDVEGYGTITAPNHKGIPMRIKSGGLWAADVGCLTGPSFVKKADFDTVFEWLNKTMLPYKDACIFVAGFDVVGDSGSTLETYEEFSRYFISGGWPFAYVAQNGAELLPIPESCSAVFVGGVKMDGTYFRKSKDYSGTMNQLDWKESLAAVSVIKRGQEAGKHIHIGRVNWQRKYNLFNILDGSEDFTCDGTRTRNDGSEKTIRAWNGYEAQRPLLTI